MFRSVLCNMLGDGGSPNPNHPGYVCDAWRSAHWRQGCFSPLNPEQYTPWGSALLQLWMPDFAVLLWRSVSFSMLCLLSARAYCPVYLQEGGSPERIEDFRHRGRAEGAPHNAARVLVAAFLRVAVVHAETGRGSYDAQAARQPIRRGSEVDGSASERRPGDVVWLLTCGPG